jgi:hypothetical protein
MRRISRRDPAFAFQVLSRNEFAFKLPHAEMLTLRASRENVADVEGRFDIAAFRRVKSGVIDSLASFHNNLRRKLCTTLSIGKGAD